MKVKYFVKTYITDFFDCFFSKEKIIYYNWWNKKDFWFSPFIENRKIHFNQPVIFTSVFGKRSPFFKYFRGKKIFFTGENVGETTICNHWTKFSDHLLEEVDLSMGFSYIEHPQYLRFPLWVRTLVSPTDKLEDICRKIDKINNPVHRLNKNRIYFAALISGHDVRGIRTKMLNTLQKLEKNIACAGRFMKNNSDLQDKFGDNKIEYLKQFKFNICPENSSERGYVTEKIFQSIMSGCIPIYWGGGAREYIEPEIINQEAFLYYEESKEDELLAKLEKLTSDEQAYREFCKIPPFKEGAAEVIWGWICELEKRLRNL